MSISVAGHSALPWPSSTANQVAAGVGVATLGMAAGIAVKTHMAENMLGPLAAGAVVAGGAWATSKLMTGRHWNPFEATLGMGIGGGLVAGAVLGGIASLPRLGGDGIIGPTLGFAAVAAFAAGSLIGGTYTAITH